MFFSVSTSSVENYSVDIQVLIVLCSKNVSDEPGKTGAGKWSWVGSLEERKMGEDGMDRFFSPLIYWRQGFKVGCGWKLRLVGGKREEVGFRWDRGGGMNPLYGFGLICLFNEAI